MKRGIFPSLSYFGENVSHVIFLVQLEITGKGIMVLLLSVIIDDIQFYLDVGNEILRNLLSIYERLCVMDLMRIVIVITLLSLCYYFCV